MGKKTELTQSDYERAASILGCEPAAIRAVAEVESSRYGGFLSTGEPVILFERHIFHRLTKGLYQHAKAPLATVPAASTYLSLPSPGGYGPVSIQHAKLAHAVELDRTAALMSCSWGLFQVMGFNYEPAGFSTLQDFINAMYRGVDEHLLAFTGLIIAWKLEAHLRKKEWAKFARAYNGPQYAKNAYDVKMRDAYEKYSV